jgi:hypothetical protein
VKSITFPYGSSFSVGSLATIQITLEKPVEQSVRLTGSRTIDLSQRPTGPITPQGAQVFWKIIPADAFEQAGGGSPYDPNGLNTLVIPVGNEFGQITVNVKSCPGSSTSSTVKIQTWRINQNTYQPPFFKEQQFTVTCPQN